MVATSMLSESDMTYERRTAHVRTYNWPPFYLNLWIFVMLLASGSIMGVFSIFIQTQERLELGIPWSVPLSPFHRDQHRNTDSENRYFPYFIAVGAHTVVFIFGLFWLIYNRRLLPAIVMIGAFMLFILWMVGLVVTSVIVRSLRLLGDIANSFRLGTLMNKIPYLLERALDEISGV